MKDEVVLNALGHDGMRKIKVIGDDAIDAELYKYLIPSQAMDKAVFSVGADMLLNIHSLEITFPVYGPWEVVYPSPKKFRRFMFVHFLYSERVSNCMEMAQIEFYARTRFAPRDAYVQELPKGAELWMDVHGCILQVADWMPAQCVAVGGHA